MASNSVSRKQLNRAIAKKKNAFKRELESIENPRTTAQNQNVELAKKENIADFYKKLTPLQRKALEKELELKKVRDNYALYLKYVYPDYKFTIFHALLANICQTVVKKVENGEKVRLCISCPPQHGKGFPVDFPILTTKGWKNHGELQAGDYVYNDKGEQVAVLGNQTPYYHKCLKITFANGESQIITREHLWKVYFERDTHLNGKRNRFYEERIIETQELKEILPKCRRSPYVLINEPLKNEHKELSINPYVLGLWLGDGTSKSNDICCSDLDLSDELCGICEKEPYTITKRKCDNNISMIKIGNDFTKRLKELNLYNNKHIPVEYLLSSEEQRFELLRGLMDTDGCCDVKGNCEFCNINKELAYNVYTLLHSLGIKARIGEYDAKLYGRFISKKYRVSFTANRNDFLFYIKRKQDRVNKKVKADRADKYKYFIKSIEEVEDKLVSCISVEGGMYLAGIELIPTHNSKTITETLPSWFIGRNPEMRAILTAYNSDIAEKFGNKNRQLIKDFGKEIFGLEISDSQDNKTLWDLKGHNGGLYSAGILAGITSNTSQLTIIDDPYKNGEEANNPTIRERVYQTTADSILTRSNGKGNAVIVIHTRWHDDDLIGRLQKLGWAVINIPCIWEDGVDKLLHRQIGQTLCPELGFDAEWALQMQQILGRRKWNALYQGKPYVEGGNIIKREDLRFYDKNTIPNDFEEYVLSCDLTFGGLAKTNDPYCMTLWGRNGGNHYLLKIYNKRAGFKDTANAIRIICGEYPRLRKKIVEKKANGWATIEMLGQEVGGFVPYDPKNLSKEDRLNNVSPYFEGGNVYFPSEDLEPNIENFITQLLRFPNTEHDDFVDTISQYLLNYEYRYGGKVNTDSSLSLLSKAIRGF